MSKTIPSDLQTIPVGGLPKDYPLGECRDTFGNKLWNTGIGFNEGLCSYPTIPSIPAGFTGTAQVGRQLYVGDGVSLKLLLPTPVQTPFNPSRLSGLQLWLDASDPLSKADGTPAVLSSDVIGFLPDKSGKGRGVNAITGSPRPTTVNGLSAIQLNPTKVDGNANGSYLATPGFIDSTYITSGITIVIAAKSNNGTVSATQVIAGMQTPTAWFELDAPRTSANTLGGLSSFAYASDRGTIDGSYIMGWDGGTKAFFGLNSSLSALINTASDITLKGTVGGTCTFANNPLFIGGNGANSFGFNGIFCECLVYNRSLTEAEVSSVQGYMMTKWGFDLPTVVCGGDSLTSGTGSAGSANQSQNTGTSNYPNQLKALMGGESQVTVRTDAAPGRSLAPQNTSSISYPASADRLYNTLYKKASTKKQVFVAWAGTNDLSGEGSAYEYFVEWCKDAQTTGYKVAAVTILPRQDTGSAITNAIFETRRQAFNTKLRLNYRYFAEYLIDLDLITQLSNPANTTYFNADTVHLTDAGYAQVANAVYQVIK